LTTINLNKDNNAMPTYKNNSETDLEGIVGIGSLKAGESKTVADPIDHPDLTQVDDNEATALQATEPSTDQEVTEAEHVAETPHTAPQVAPPAPAPVAPPEQPPVSPTPPAPENNVNIQGA
jgi:hypothetical protein